MNLRPALRLITTALLGAALAACAPAMRPPATSATEQHAQALIDAGQPQAAAEVYLRAAHTAQPPARQRFQLLAAQQLIDAQQYDRAQSVLDSVNPKGLNGEALARKALLYARLDLALRQPDAALRALPADTSGLPDTLVAELLLTKALAAEAAGKPLLAVRSRLERQPLLGTQQAADNLRALWSLLTQASPSELGGWQQTAQREDVKAWLALALIATTTAPQPAALTQALAAWEARYPGQQAAAAPILDALRTQWQSFQTYPSQIAVLLPLSGPFSPVARTLLDGIMSAYYAHANPAHPIALRVYDTGAQPANLLSLYAQAVADGARFVIGPLDRNQVGRLAASGIVSVPTLALNYVNGDAALPDQLYEFGLNPGNEAAQAAEKASLDGHLKAVVLVPNSDWGARVSSAFAQRFQQLGGRVLAVGRFNGGGSDFSPAIVRALNIDASNARRRGVAQTIRQKLKFDARRRQDVDMIFIAGDPRQARLLMPQIDFHHGTGLPVYSISDAYSGTRDAVADRDLNGLLFCDAPLLLSDAGTAAAARTAMQRDFPNAGHRYPRLYGLGMDSFDVIPYLKRLADQGWARFDGLSGALHMVGGHRLVRQLEWAQFAQGAPQLQGMPAAQADSPAGGGNDAPQP